MLGCPSTEVNAGRGTVVGETLPKDGDRYLRTLLAHGAHRMYKLWDQ